MGWHKKVTYKKINAILPPPFVLKLNRKKMDLLFKSPLPPLLSKGQKHFWVFYILSKKRHEKSILPTRFEQFSLYADALLLKSLFFVCEKEAEDLVVGYRTT